MRSPGQMFFGHVRHLSTWGGRLPLAVAALCWACSTFLATDARAQGPIVNSLCPVMTEEPVDPRFTVAFEGRMIGFCCEKCVEKFTANPDRYRDRLPRPPSKGAEDAMSADSVAQPSSGAPPASEAATTWTELAGRYHPLIVHFPLAGAPLALLGLCFWLWTKRPEFAAADMPPLFLAAIASAAAVVTGNIAEESTEFSSSLKSYLLWHEYAGTTLMVLIVCLACVRAWLFGRMSGTWLRLYAAGLICTCLIAALTGYLGGAIVLGPDHLWP